MDNYPPNELRKRYKACGTDKARVGFLKEAHEDGLITKEKLMIAALCGNIPSRELLGEEAPPKYRELKRWLLAIEKFGHEAVVRAAAASARSILYCAIEDGYPREVIINTILAAEDWVIHQNQSYADIASIAGEGLMIYVEERDRTSKSGCAAMSVVNAARSVHNKKLLPTGTTAQAVHPMGGHVWGSICCDLVDWALGFTDPIGYRTAERRWA